jgi:adenylate cyclase
MSAYVESESVILNPLKASGLLSANDIAKIRHIASQDGDLFTNVMLRLGLVRESELLRIFAELYDLHILRSDVLRLATIEEAAVEMLPVRVAERLRVFPKSFEPHSGSFEVVAAVPLASGLVNEVQRATGALRVEVRVATTACVRAGIRKAYYGIHSAFDDVSPNGAGPVDIGIALSDSDLVAATALEIAHDAKTQVVAKSPVEDDVETLRKENARFRIAQAFYRKLQQERSTEAMIRSIISTLFELVPADGAGVWLTSGEHQFQSRQGIAGGSISQTVLDKTLVSKSGLLVHDALADKRIGTSESVILRGVKSVISVPLRTGNGTLGVLYLESVSQVAAFNEDDVPLVEAIGVQAATLLDNAALLTRVKKEVEHRANLSRFLSPVAVDEVLSGRLTMSFKGQLANVAVLFADVRGFTELSQHLEPQEVVRFLNVFFERAVDTVERNHGLVDKFIGDCVMALWGAEVPHVDDAKRAMAAALEMVARAKKIVVNGKPLSVGVGIHFGPAVVGAIGTGHRSDYTAIGNTVNVAARLCSIARPDEVLISGETLHHGGTGVVGRPNPSVRLKGVSEPVIPYTLESIGASGPILLSVRHHQS